VAGGPRIALPLCPPATKFERVINRSASSEIILTEQWVKSELVMA